MRSVFVVCVVVTMAGSAAAQPGLTPSSPSSASSPASPAGPPGLVSGASSSGPSSLGTPGEARPTDAPAQPRRDREVSEGTALALPLGSTLVSWSVVAVGAAADSGPLALAGLAGTLITPSFGNWYAGGSAAPWLGMRVAGAAVTLYGLQRVFDCLDDCVGDDGHSATTIFAGFGIYLAGTIIDIATAPSAARRYQRARRPLTVAPTAHPGGGGLAIGGAF